MPGDLGKQLCVPNPSTAVPTSCFRAHANPPRGGGDRGIGAAFHSGATEAARNAVSVASSANPAHRPRRGEELGPAPAERGHRRGRIVRSPTTARPRTTWATGQPNRPVADTVNRTTQATTNDSA